MSIPAAAVTIAGWVMVRAGSMTAIVGRRRGWLIPVFTLSVSTSSTQIVVLSLTVPGVVGTAISGLSGCVGANVRTNGALMESTRTPSLVPRRFSAFAVTTADIGTGWVREIGVRYV